MNTLKAFVKPHKIKIIIAMSIKSLGTAIELLIPFILTYMIDYFIPTGEVSLVIVGGLAMLLCTVLALVGNVLGNRLASQTARTVVEEVRHELFKKTMHLSAMQTDKVGIPSLISRITSDSYNIHTMLNMIMRMGIRAPVLLVGGILLTSIIEYRLALIMVAMLPPMAIIVIFISKKGIPLFTAVQEKVDVMVRNVRENATGVRVIKALSKTEDEKLRFEKSVNELVKAELVAGNMMAVTNPLINLLLNLGLTLVILFGAFLVSQSLALPGAIVGFLSYFVLILNAVLAIGRMFVLYSKGAASANRIEKVLTLPEDLKVLTEKELEDLGMAQSEDILNYHIVFDGVNFSYNKKINDLTDINFALKKGETLGIIGATGSGKSTLIQLLMRLYDVDGGGIYIDGEDIRGIAPEVLHKKFGVVFQSDNIFADTLAQNVRFGREIDDEEVRRALFNAQADYVENLPDNIFHNVDIRGVNLSGGQKQRLLIGRALAGTPEILVLDDASSALDYKTDAKLRASLKEHYNSVTKVIIAQRISSIMSANHIIMLHEGKVLGQGTHEYLLETCEDYRKISESQMGMS